MPKRAVKALEIEYREKEGAANDFAIELVRQLSEVLAQANVPLAVPIERRVKKWESLAEKLDRRSLTLASVCDLHDLIGLRAILLFHRDVDKTSNLIGDKFSVLTKEDTIQRLAESQFGYASIHFVIQVPAEWLKVPTLARFSGFKAEIQVRTVAQHLWAASSHFLQYKQEQNIPPPIRRSIHRVSALLETVDLEFERVLKERELYKDRIDVQSKRDVLNVDSLARVLSELLPASHFEEPEEYADLLSDVLAFGLETPDELRALITTKLPTVLQTDAEIVANRRATKSSLGTTTARTAKGVYFSWVGLTREALKEEFGDQWVNYNHAKWSPLTTLDLPEKLIKILAEANIEVVVDLASKTEQELLHVRGMSSDDVNQIKRSLSNSGLSLGIDKTLAIFALADARRRKSQPKS